MVLYFLRPRFVLLVLHRNETVRLQARRVFFFFFAADVAKILRRQMCRSNPGVKKCARDADVRNFN